MNCNLAVIKGDGIGPGDRHRSNESLDCCRRKVWTYIFLYTDTDGWSIH